MPPSVFLSGNHIPLEKLVLRPCCMEYWRPWSQIPDPPLLSNGTSGSHSIFLSLSFPTNELWWWLKENKAHKPSSKVLAHSNCSMNAICNPFPSLFRESLTRLSRAKPGPVACRPGAEPKGLLECQTAPAAAASLSVTGSDAILLKVMANGFHHLPGKVPYNPEASEGPQSLLLGSCNSLQISLLTFAASYRSTSTSWPQARLAWLKPLHWFHIAQNKMKCLSGTSRAPYDLNLSAPDSKCAAPLDMSSKKTIHKTLSWFLLFS